MAQAFPHSLVMILYALFFIFSIMYVRSSAIAASSFEKKISEESLSAGLYYGTQALPCLSKNQNALDETKRFVLDKTMLDSELGNLGRLDCAFYRAIKYGLYVFDLDNPAGKWTFRNYQSPLDEDNFIPRYGQIVTIDDNGVYHRGFVGVYTDMPESKGKVNLSLWMYCNTTAASEASDYTLIYNAYPAADKYGSGDIYKYSSNDCDSMNCIKGPGQALPACQPKEYSYSKNAGEACAQKYECKTVSCTGGKCDNKAVPQRLVAGQPCRQDDECAGGLVCAYDKRCRESADGGWDISKFNYV